MKQITDLLNTMILLNLENQRKYQKTRSLIGNIAFICEFGSVYFDIGRQVGKSSYIVEYLQKLPSASVIVYNERMQRHLWHIFTSRDSRVYTYNNIQAKSHTDLYRGFTTIFIDEPGMFRATELDFIYRSMQNEKEQVFVHLGRPIL